MLDQRGLTPERRLAYQREHRQLVEALKRHDLACAKALASAHLQRMRRNLLNF